MSIRRMYVCWTYGGLVIYDAGCEHLSYHLQIGPQMESWQHGYQEVLQTDLSHEDPEDLIVYCFTPAEVTLASSAAEPAPVQGG